MTDKKMAALLLQLRERVTKIDIHCEDDDREPLRVREDGSPELHALCDEPGRCHVVPCAPREGFMLLLESKHADNLCKRCLGILHARAS